MPPPPHCGWSHQRPTLSMYTHKGPSPTSQHKTHTLWSATHNRSGGVNQVPMTRVLGAWSLVSLKRRRRLRRAAYPWWQRMARSNSCSSLDSAHGSSDPGNRSFGNGPTYAKTCSSNGRPGEEVPAADFCKRARVLGPLFWNKFLLALTWKPYERDPLTRTR